MLGYVVKHDYQGEGFGLEAVTAVLSFAKPFRLPIYATITPTNIVSKRLAERCGLKKMTNPLPDAPEFDCYRLEQET